MASIRNPGFDRDSKGKIALIPAGRFDIAGLSPKRRIEAWHEACHDFYDVTMERHTAPASRAFFTWHRLDNLMFSSGISYPHQARRTRAHINRQKSYVRVLFPRQRRSTMIIDDRIVELNRDRVHLIDYSRPFVHVRDNGIDLDGVYVPHDELGYDGALHPGHMCLDVDTPFGQVLASTFFALQSRLRMVTVSEAPILATGFKDLVRTLMLRDEHSERGLAVARAARRNAMRAFIEKNLRDRSLDIGSLSRVFHVSRPTVYRAFETEGGVESYIVGRRLERAFMDLANAPTKRGIVSEVSQSWGFGSPSHFNRRFRSRFGMAPSEAAKFTPPTDAGAPKGKTSPGRQLPGKMIDKNLSAWFANTL